MKKIKVAQSQEEYLITNCKKCNSDSIVYVHVDHEWHDEPWDVSHWKCLSCHSTFSLNDKTVAEKI